MHVVTSEYCYTRLKVLAANGADIVRGNITEDTTVSFQNFMFVFAA